MEDFSELLVDSKTDERFNKLFRNALKKNKLSVAKRGSKDYYIVTDGNDTLGFDISAEKYEYAKSRDPYIADRLAERIINEFDILIRLVSFTNGQEFLRYTVVRSELVSKDMICEDFMGNLKKVICYTADNVHARYIDEGYMKKWDVPKEVLFSVADRNMCRLLRKTDISESSLNGAAGLKCLDLKAEGNDFTAALMMCADFHSYLADKIGHRFLVAAPSKDNIIVMSEVTNNVLERLGAAIVGEYRWASRPLTTDIFLYTSMGTEIAGHFSEIET